MMKRIISLLAALMLYCCVAIAEEVPTVSLQAWLDVKGDCCPCRVEVTVVELINPVLALVSDESGSVHLFGVTVDGAFTDFLTLQLAAGDVLTIENPQYNEFEGSIEMADAVLISRIPAA